MRNILEKYCKGNQNTLYFQSHFFEGRAVYEIMSKIMVEPEVADGNVVLGKYSDPRVRLHARTPRLTHTSTHPCTHTFTHVSSRERAHSHRHGILLHGNNSFVKASQCYGIRTLPVVNGVLFRIW